MREVDLVVIGAGVAGLTAATVAARLGHRVLVIERTGAGGQVMNVEGIDNMPGFEPGVSGFALGPELQDRAEGAGAEFMLDTVQRLSREGERHLVHVDGEPVAARAVLVAAGSRRRKMGVLGEDRLEGRGVSHCASCDGPLFRGLRVIVAGGGDSAFGEAAALAAHAGRVSLVFPGALPHAMAGLVERLARLPNVALLPGSRVEEVTGDERVTGVLLRDAAGVRVLPAEGIFVCVGLQADTEFVDGVLKLDEAGRIETDAALNSSVPGVFAAGDIRAGAGYLLASAESDGAAAARAIDNYLREGTQA